MRLARLSCSPAFNEITGFAYVLAAPRKSPSLSTGSRSNASLRSNLCKNGKIKEVFRPLFILRLARFVLDLLHAHGYSPLSPVGLSRLVPFAIRICACGTPSVRKSAERFDKAHALCTFGKSCQNK